MAKKTPPSTNKRGSKRDVSAGVRHIDSIHALTNICDSVVALLGSKSEAVLHDFSDLDHSIVHVSGNVTGRSVGGPLTDLGVKTLLSRTSDQGVLLYHSKSPSGTLLKSVSVLLRDASANEVVGAVCINMEIDVFQRFREVLGDFVELPASEPLEEQYAEDTPSLIRGMIEKIMQEREWIFTDLNREQRVVVVKCLKDRGAFAYRSGPQIVADVLGLSRYTVYKYLKD